MKYELKIEIKETKPLVNLIKKSYKDGVLSDKTQKLTYDKNSAMYNLCKGLSNLFIRLYNDKIMDGSIKFIINEEEENIGLYPCSLYCEYENKKYNFSA